MNRVCRPPVGVVLTALAALAFAVGVPASVRAQEAKRDVEIKTQGKASIDAPTPRRNAAMDRKGPTLGGERFVRRGTLEAMAEEKWREAFGLLDRLIDSTSDDDPAKPELYFRLSEMHWERSAALNIKAFDTEGACLERANGKAQEAACEAEKQRILVGSQKYRDQAIRVYVDIVQNFPKYERLDEVLFALAYNYQQKNAPDKAKRMYVALIKRYPKSKHIADTLLNIGELYFDDGEVEQALKAYRKVTTNYQESTVYGYALYKLGWCYFNLGDYKNSLGSFIKVIEFTNNLKGKKRSKNRLALKREAQKDLVRVYVNLEAASPQKAIGFFRKVAPEDYARLSEDLAELYSLTGQFSKSNQLYRELIKLQPNTYRIVSFQRAIAFNTRNVGTDQVSIIKEVKRLVTLWTKAKGAQDAEPQRVAKDEKAIEELLRSMSVTYHRQALRTKADADYAVAYELYRDYVNAFPEGDNAYLMTFYFAELLYKLKKWEESAHNYERVLELQADGEFTKDAAHGTVLAYKKLLLDERQPAKRGDEKSAEEQGVPQPLPLTTNHERFIKACDLYSRYVKDSEFLVDIIYDGARVYYDHNQFDKAVPRFKQISEDHVEHRLAVYAANLLLDTYALQKDYKVLNAQVDIFLKLYTEERDPQFYATLIRLKEQSTFNECLGLEKDKNWLVAAKCFRDYSKRFPEAKDLDKALWNAALNFERAKRMEDAIQMRLALVNSASESELVPKALYRIGTALHALAIYSQASRFYEIFADQFSKDDNAQQALQNAAVFRQGLGQYDKALADYHKYLSLVGKNKKKSADVFFNMGTIYERQGEWKKMVDHFNKYLREYAKYGKPGQRFQAYTKIGNAYQKQRNERAAQKAYETCFLQFNKLSVDKMKGVGQDGLAAVAEARFQMGEAIYAEFSAFKLNLRPHRNLKKFVTQMGTLISKRTTLITRAQTIYEEVIKYGSANWAIAALTRIGQMYQQLANDIYNAPAPGSFTADQKEVFKGEMAERGSTVETKAIDAYAVSLAKARELNWFNKWTELAEKQLARLNPREYRYAAERRAQPDHFGRQVIGQAFVATLPAEVQ